MLKVEMITKKYFGSKVRIVNDKNGQLLFEGQSWELSGTILDREVNGIFYKKEYDALELCVE